MVVSNRPALARLTSAAAVMTSARAGESLTASPPDDALNREISEPASQFDIEAITSLSAPSTAL